VITVYRYASIFIVLLFVCSLCCRLLKRIAHLTTVCLKREIYEIEIHEIRRAALRVFAILPTVHPMTILHFFCHALWQLAPTHLLWAVASPKD